MEYLEVKGAVKLKAGFDKAKVNSVLLGLANIKFEQSGFMDISVKEDVLSIHADGVIGENNTVSALFIKLQEELAEGSTILMFSVRWEFYVTLVTVSPLLQTKFEELIPTKIAV